MIDEFYIGWQARAPRGIGLRIRNATAALLVLALALACMLALGQRTIGVAVFEWGKLKTFHGVLQSRPYPHLLVSRPGRGAGESAYYLVAPFKFGLNAETLAAHDGQAVTLQGTLIYRGGQTMLEVRPESLKAVSTNAPRPASSPVALGRQTLVGEIVDSKCWLGVMNPGRLAPHRACAVRCISGGIPPILLVRRQSGPPSYYLLVSTDGRPVNKQVLDMVAEPVEITGEVVSQDGLPILRADPATYKRLRK